MKTLTESLDEVIALVDSTIDDNFSETAHFDASHILERTLHHLHLASKVGVTMLLADSNTTEAQAENNLELLEQHLADARKYADLAKV